MVSGNTVLLSCVMYLKMCAEFPEVVSSQGRIRTLNKFQPLAMSKGLVMAVGTWNKFAATMHVEVLSWERVPGFFVGSTVRLLRSHAACQP